MPQWQGFLQRKLSVGATNDPLEAEADRIAEQVLATPAGVASLGGARVQLARQGSPVMAGDELVPSSVERVLSSPGAPLDPRLREEMGQRFGHDFAQVRVHADAVAQRSAMEIGAQAYTLGHEVVFGAGGFAPETRAGRRLLAHELTHVVQQSGGGERTTDHHGEPRAASGRQAAVGVIARQPAPAPASAGWRDALEKTANRTETTVDDKGNIASGKAATKGVWRVPVEGLSHGLKSADAGAGQESAKGRAVVLIPNTVKAVAAGKDKNVAVDVLLHFHGRGIGYRQLQHDKKDYGEVLAEGEVRDVGLYQMEQQLLAHVATGQQLLIAVLPQGSDRARFGDLGSGADDYLNEVFGKLTPTFLPEKAVPGHVIVSGHSGGGLPAMAVANQRSKPTNRTDVLLFDAINFSCTDKEEVTGKDGSKKMACKKDSPCASNEYNTVRDWVTARINEDVQGLGARTAVEQAADLQATGTRLRGITTKSLKTTDTCSYGFWYGKLDKHIDATIKKLKPSTEVDAQLRRNFRVSEAQGLGGFTGMETHERMMGQHNLEDALKR